MSERERGNFVAPKVRVGSPTITDAAIGRVMRCLVSGRVSEGVAVDELERALAATVGAKHAILFNSGHSALVASYLTAKRNHGVKIAVTTSLTFISTISAALEAGLDVECMDVNPGTFLINANQARERLQKEQNSVYVPVHLFGYRAEILPQFFMIQDCCEAFGTGGIDRPVVGLPHIGCYSFYTSHVMGAGEMGFAVTDNEEDAIMLRKVKDQGRKYLRPASHVATGAAAPPGERYSHDQIGYNFRTTDVQASIILGSLPELGTILKKRQTVVKGLNRVLSQFKSLTLPEWRDDVSYLAYPIICDTPETRNKLLVGLDERGIETRPLMSLIPQETAITKLDDGRFWAPFGFEEAKKVFDRSFYISSHDSLCAEDMKTVHDAVKDILG